MKVFDPLEQFLIEIHIGFLATYIETISFGFLFIRLSPLSWTTFANTVFVCCFVPMFLINKKKSIFFNSKFEMVNIIVFNIAKKVLLGSLSVKKHSFILLVYAVFLFIFLSNILGMVPYSITITSHLILTLYFSLAFFIGTNLVGICLHKEKYFALFLPEGVPVIIIPVLVLIEWVSYFSRIFSLAIRLFANMMSGHILLKILISFLWGLLITNFSNWFWIILPILISIIVIFLEIIIAFLQAYVFIVLLTIYLNDAISPH